MKTSPILPAVLAICGLFAHSSATAQCEGTLSGIVTIDGNPCEDCTVTALLEPTGSLVWPTADEVQTGSDGSYSVVLPENSVVILLVKAAETYANAVPTFSGSVVKWGNAVSFNNECDDVFTADVAVVHHQPRMGNTTLSGRVVLSSGKMQAEDPISLIEIVVEFTSGSPVGSTVSDENGEFEIDNVESIGAGTYTVRVNLPCVPNPGTYELTVSEEDLEIGNIDFCIDADTTLIANCTLTGIGTDPDALTVRKKARVAVDPIDGSARILFDGDHATLAVYDMGGSKVLTEMRVTSGQTFSVDHLPGGLYIAELNMDGTVQHVRFPKF